MERRREESDSGADTGAPTEQLDICFTISHCCKTEQETGREGVGGCGVWGGGGGSVLDLIFHTPASYKQLSYTTLAPNNQAGEGSQKGRNTLSLTA